MKKIVGLLIVLALVFSLVVGCSQETAEPEGSDDQTPQEGKAPEDIKIGIVMKSFDEFQNAVIAGAKDTAIEMGVKEENIIALAPEDESGVTDQVQMIENCISQGVDILILSAQNPDAVNAPLQQAADKGIKIVMADTDAPKFESEHKVTYIGTNNYKAAYDGAKVFIERYLEEGQNVVLLRCKLGDPNHDERTNGLDDACKELGINVLEVKDTNCESEKSANIMANLITKYGDKINGVLVTSDNVSIGAITSIKAANMTDKIAVCGFDGFQVSIQAVANGEEKMIIGQKPYWMGQEAVKCGMGALLEGKTYEAYIDPGIEVIDEDNYQDFLK